MVDVASIVVAVVALVASLGAAAVTVGFSYMSEERKNRKESKALIAKYGDPLLLAALDLQSRLYNLTEWKVSSYINSNDDRRDNLLLYTAFVFGQYFAWNHILRRKTQFLRFEKSTENKQLTKALTDIRHEFGEDTYDADGALFMLWRGDQMALGQAMTVEENDELTCMGYAEFRRQCAEDGLDFLPKSPNRRGTMNQPSSAAVLPQEKSRISESPVDIGRAERVKGRSDGMDEPDDELKPSKGTGDFRRWILPIVNDVKTLANASTKDKNIASVMLAKKYPRPVSAVDVGDEPANTVPISDQRLRRLQHLLIQLIELLDKDNLRFEADKMSRCHRAIICPCVTCTSGHCDCKDCLREETRASEAVAAALKRGDGLETIIEALARDYTPEAARAVVARSDALNSKQVWKHNGDMA